VHWTDKYVGIPFEWNRCDFSGVSCWGLVVLVYKEEYGISLPDNSNFVSMVKEGIETPTDVYKKGMVPVSLDEAKEGNLLHLWTLLNNKQAPLHVGIVVDKKRVLHCQRSTGVVIERFNTDLFARRVIGAYKYVS